MFHFRLATAFELLSLNARVHDEQVGLFAFGQPYQFTPPQYGWTVIAPPIVGRPKPGAPPKPPAPFKPLWQDQDWTYLNTPDNVVIDPFDFAKQIKSRRGGIVSNVSGEFRWQGRVEDNRRLTGEQNNFNLFRERLALDTWYEGIFRTYLDVFWADASEQTVPPIFFDNNHGDVLNAFGEVKLKDVFKGTFSARFGFREQLLFGNQRLVSPLDWANSPRTFNTVAHGLYRSDNWAMDFFWSRPNLVKARQLDQPLYNLQFFGAYLTYKAIPDQVVDLYYLGLLDDGGKVKGSEGRVGDSALNTFGTRWQMDRNNWLGEIEAAYQFGTRADLAKNAGMATLGIGRRFADMQFKPELWFYYDYASGTQNPDGTSDATFNQLFPLGHKYFGYMDLVGRQNILDPNVNLKFYLSDRVNVLFWYHHFQLASARDALYNAAGVPSRRDSSGRAGRDVGDELDIVANVILNPHSDLQFGLSYFWAGSFVQDTAATPAQAKNGSFLYTQYTFRF